MIYTAWAWLWKRSWISTYQKMYFFCFVFLAGTSGGFWSSPLGLASLRKLPTWGGWCNLMTSGCGVAKVKANQRLHRVITISFVQRLFFVWSLPHFWVVTWWIFYIFFLNKWVRFLHNTHKFERQSVGESPRYSAEPEILTWRVMEVLKPTICLCCREQKTWISLNESSGSNDVVTASRLQSGF